uniref:Uncharacterized protein n=1 Tax=Oryza punctata TaxID=4537 RepID=A0A0E0LZQ6_ORYPU
MIVAAAPSTPPPPAPATGPGGTILYPPWMDRGGDARRRAMLPPAGDGVVTGSIHRRSVVTDPASTTSTKSTPLPNSRVTRFGRTGALEVHTGELAFFTPSLSRCHAGEAAARRPGLRHTFLAIPHGSQAVSYPAGCRGTASRSDRPPTPTRRRSHRPNPADKPSADGGAAEAAVEARQFWRQRWMRKNQRRRRRWWLRRRREAVTKWRGR